MVCSTELFCIVQYYSIVFVTRGVSGSLSSPASCKQPARFFDFKFLTVPKILGTLRISPNWALFRGNLFRRGCF